VPHQADNPRETCRPLTVIAATRLVPPSTLLVRPFHRWFIGTPTVLRAPSLGSPFLPPVLRSCLLPPGLLDLRITFCSREPGSSTHTNGWSLSLFPHRPLPVLASSLSSRPLEFSSFLPASGEGPRAREQRAIYSIRLDYNTRSRYFPASARYRDPSH